MSGWMERCEARLPDTLAFLEEMVRSDSPSGDKESLSAAADVVARWFDKLDVTTKVHPDPDYGPTLEITAGTGERTVLLVGHIDTVWPLGEAEKRPFAVKDDRAYGPGVCDMKAGIAIAWSAMASVLELGMPADRRVVLIVNPDEEIGSPSSKGLIQGTGLGSEAALILEPAGPGGAIKTRRRGVIRYRVIARGRSAHGSDPGAGVNAIVELARQLARLSDQPADPEWSMSVGTIAGGERVNVVPSRAEAEIDVRVDSGEAEARVDELLRGMKPMLPGALIEVKARRGHPPFEATPQNRELYARAREIAAGQGIELVACMAAGASDGNYLSASGVATLDGLGAVGGGAHALDEYVVVDSLVSRSALVGMLVSGL